MAKLAIKGGNKCVIEQQLPWPIVEQKDRDMILEALNSRKWFRFLYSDKEEDKSYTTQFEKKFAQYHGSKYALAVANGTAAISLSLKALGIESGDEVLVTPVTFIASATAILEVNAIPVFVDIDTETLNLSPEDMERKITSRTKCCVVVHYGGRPADMDRILEVAKKHSISVVEDCSHAHGSQWRGRGVGTFGECGAFSFQQSKTLASGEGGIILTQREDIRDLLYSYHHLGRLPGKDFYDHYMPSWNYRITDLQGALLLSQLERLPAQIEKREENMRHFEDLLAGLDGIELRPRDERITREGFYFYVLKYKADKFNGVPRDIFLKSLIAEGVNAFDGYGKALFQVPLFSKHKFGRTGCPIMCPLGEQVKNRYSGDNGCSNALNFCCNQQITIMHYQFLGSKKLIKEMADSFFKITENIDELEGEEK